MTLAMSRAPAGSRDSMAERATSGGSRPASSAARRVRDSHLAWGEMWWRWGRGVGGRGGGGEREGHGGLGAAGHGGVEPLAGFGAGAQRYPGVHGSALRGGPGERVRQVTGAVAGVREGLAGEPPLPGLG